MDREIGRVAQAERDREAEEEAVRAGEAGGDSTLQGTISNSESQAGVKKIGRSRLITNSHSFEAVTRMAHFVPRM
jgi:hypothetical protein